MTICAVFFLNCIVTNNLAYLYYFELAAAVAEYSSAACEHLMKKYEMLWISWNKEKIATDFEVS